jgi:hypothetical protein
MDFHSETGEHVEYISEMKWGGEVFQIKGYVYFRTEAKGKAKFLFGGNGYVKVVSKIRECFKFYSDPKGY